MQAQTIPEDLDQRIVEADQRFWDLGDPDDAPSVNRRVELLRERRMLRDRRNTLHRVRNQLQVIAKKLGPVRAARDRLLAARDRLETECDDAKDALAKILEARPMPHDTHKRRAERRVEDLEAGIAAIAAGRDLGNSARLCELMLDWRELRPLAWVERRIAELERQRRDLLAQI